MSPYQLYAKAWTLDNNKFHCKPKELDGGPTQHHGQNKTFNEGHRLNSNTMDNNEFTTKIF